MKAKCSLLLICFSLWFYAVARSQNVGHFIYEVQMEHAFSSPLVNDKFELTLWGENIFDGIITFKISDSNKNYLYFEQFTVGELMEFGPPETDLAYERSSDDSTFIILMMKQFFDERNFWYPAIADSSQMKDNYSDFETWNIIWQENAPIGFHYLLGAEDGRAIAYSIRQKKVIVYFTCC
jgi:hypothetical protein